MNKINIKKIVILLLAFCIILFGSIFVPLQKNKFKTNDIHSTRIYDRHGILLRQVLSSEEGISSYISLDQIPESIKYAFLSAEDKRFYRHCGIDFLAIVRAIRSYFRYGEVKSGASTISQQLIRVYHHYPRNVFTKLYEMWLALRLEHTLSKDQILEHYLNRIPFGNQTFGIDAAVTLYFAKPIADITAAEAAFLAAIPKSPTYYNPYRYFEHTKMRQEKILKLMFKNGFIDEKSYHRVCQQKIVLTDRDESFKAPHFCNFMINKYVTDSNRPQKIVTTIHWDLQKNIQTFLSGRLQEIASFNVHNASVLVMDNHTGEILTWIGSQDFFDDAHSGQVDGVLALRQPGSLLKPFTYGIALRNGMTAATVLPDIEVNAYEQSGYYTPQNYDRQEHGPVTIRSALACSYNIPPVRLLDMFGEASLLRTLHDAGFKSLTKNPDYYGKGLTLGNGEVTLLELVRAYSALANDGELKHEKYILDGNQDLNSRKVIGSVFNNQVCAILSDILSDNEARIPAFGRMNPLNFPFDCAVKTGTSKDYRDNWTVGFTPEVTVGVWVGNFSGEPMHTISGISGAGPIFNDVMHYLDRYYNFSPFLGDSSFTEIAICPVSGLKKGRWCPTARRELFIPGTEPDDSCSWHKMFPIDSRNDKIAGPRTPQTHIIKKVFLDLPPLYYSWMRENDMPFIPRDSSKIDDSDSGSSLAIVFPNDGDIFKIDSILRPAFQKISLKALVPSHIEKIDWMVDDTLFASVARPFSAKWQLTAGQHRFQIKAGKLQSDIVKIKVLP